MPFNPMSVPLIWDFMDGPLLARPSNGRAIFCDVLNCIAGDEIEPCLMDSALSNISIAFLDPAVSIGAGDFWLSIVSGDSPVVSTRAILESSSRKPSRKIFRFMS